MNQIIRLERPTDEMCQACSVLPVTHRVHPTRNDGDSEDVLVCADCAMDFVI